MRRLGDPFAHRMGFRGLLPGVMSWWPTQYPRLRSFYVDATGGADGDDGRTPDTAWQTIGKVNGETFLPGDYVLFKRGETWVGTALAITRSGTARRPIVFADYGSGTKPILDGNDAVNCIFVSSESHLVFRNIEATQGIDAGFHFDDSHDITVIDCDAHDCGNDNLIFITDCHNCSVTRGEFYNTYQRVGGTNCAGIEIADGSHDITLIDVICYDNAGAPISGSGMGITIHNHIATVLPYNITIKGATCYDNAGMGIHVWKQDNIADSNRNILIQDCHTYGNKDGIRIHKSVGALNFPNGVIVDSCHSEGNVTYAYYIRGDNLTVQRNVFEGQGVCVECIGLDFFNNTHYFPVIAWQYPIYLTGARTDFIEVKNCIIYRDVPAGGEAQIGVDISVVLLNIDIDYNLYYLDNETVANIRWNWKGVNKNWADWKTDSNMDANSPMADQDPLFVNPGADDFRLQAGSPAIDAGVDVGLPFLGPAPDIGAFERE